MLERENNLILIVILFFVSLVLISAFVIEYGLGHQPCNLCLYERIPYILSILLIIKILFFKKYEKITLFILFLIFIASAVLAFYHFGIEQGFFSESFVCKVGDLSGTLSKEQLLEQLNKNSISCKDVSFKVLGLSLATINTILSIILSVIFLKLFLNYAKN
jgi:disulfide bond formation protein DsbB